MGPTRKRRRVAIACQGGGSHTAFTAGVLTHLLRSEELSRYEVVGLSGTSGGAVCALLAWSALMDRDPGRAGTLLEGFWADNAATTPQDQMLNTAVLWANMLANFVVTPAVSPYDTPLAATGLDSFRRLLRRRVDFGRIEVVDDPARPMLLIGAVDVHTGEFKAFNSRHDKITEDMVIASAAIPPLFRAVHVNGGTYWDGLFSQNPPVRDLLDTHPDELWVIQINPTRRDTEPRTTVEIADRRNELSGNLSLYQELHVIEKIDALLDEGLLAPGGKYTPVVVRIIELPRTRLSRLSRSLGTASKINRDPAFLRELQQHGKDLAEEFLTALAFEDAWRTQDAEAILSFFADNAELISAAPFPPHSPSRGPAEARRFLREHLTRNIRLDLTRKHIARDRVTWTVRSRPTGSVAGAGDAVGIEVRGRAEAQFSDGRITSLRLGGETA
jgi:NTE family protein